VDNGGKGLLTACCRCWKKPGIQTIARGITDRCCSPVAGYVGISDVFDRAVTHFSEIYADQAERDHASFVQAIREGRIDVEIEH